MANVDDKVVAMSFESSKFESGVARVMAMLDKLKQSLKIDNAGKGLTDIQKAGDKVDLSHIGKAVDDIRNKFSALSVAALAVFSNIAIQAVNAGARMLKAFTVQPLIDGFREYETQINAVQTILSNTTAAGTNIRDVNAALDELNTYADQTIYNFSEMARNIGTFTAAGVDLQTSVNSIKGIANLAALSGSNSQQAATAMYQLSQAISAGRVSLMDWNSVVNAGMGGTVFQRALAQTAVNMGKLDANALKLSGSMKTVTINGKSFRESLSATGPGGEQWLTGEVLTKTLEQLSGNLTDAQLKAEGYTDAQIKAIQTQARMALEAATQVKTFSQLLSTTSEALSSGWAQTWRIVFGDFNEAKRLFTGISDAVGGFIQKNAEARNQVLKDWKKLGGRTMLIQGIKNAFVALGAILGTVKDAFRDIFPAKTGRDLAGFTRNFLEFTRSLIPGEETLDKLRRTMRGVFAVLDIGKMIIGGVLGVIGDLFSAVTGGAGGFLSITAVIGDFLVALRDSIKESGAITAFFEGLGDILSKPIELISKLAEALASLFSTDASSGVSGALGGLSTVLGPLAGVVGGLASAWDRFLDSLSGTDGAVASASGAISSFFAGLGTLILNSFKNINWDSIIAVINTGLFAALVLAFKKFFGKGSLLEQIGGKDGFLSGLTGIFDGVTGSLKAMQQSLQAKAIRDIAIAIGILALSLLVLSTIPSDKMSTAMSGLITTFGLLVGAMALLNKVMVGPGIFKLPILAGGFILLAIAIGLLSTSVKFLSTLDWEELAKGLTGVTVLLGGLAASARFLSQGSLGLAAASVGIIGIAIAMKILASAVKDFGNLSWEQLGKGMAAIAGALVAIGAAARLFPPGMVVIGAGLIAVAAGLKIIASVMQDLAGLSWEQIGKGLTVIAGALVAIGAASKLMGPSLILVGPGLIAVAYALTIIGKAVEQMGGMSMVTIAKGLGTMAAALIILAGALHVMSGTLAGAAALTVAAVGIRILAGALVKMGNQSWTEIIKGMVGLAGAIGILAGASLLLGGAVPAMLAMGAALLLIGGGLALAGAGIFLIGLGLAAIATSGTAAIAVLIGGLDMLMERLPQYVEDMTQAFIAMALGIAEAAPQFIEAMGEILIALSQAIIKAAPQLVAAGVVLISNLLIGLRQLGPQIVATGISLLMDLLRGLRQNIGQITVLAVDIIVRFLNAFAGQVDRIVTAGVNIIIALLRGISNNIGRIGTAAVQIVVKLISTISNNAGRIATAGANVIIKFIQGITNNLRRVVTAATTAVIKFATSIGNNAHRLVTAGVNIITKFIQGIGQNGERLARGALKAVLQFLQGLHAAIDDYVPQITEECIAIGEAIIAGVIKGLVNKAQDAYNKAKEIANNIKDFLSNPFSIGSPSKWAEDYVGKNIILGLVKGLDEYAPKAYRSAVVMSYGVISAVKQTFGITSPSKVMKELGKFVGDGFLEGLKGSQQNIRDSVTKLSQYLVGTVEDAKAQISKLRADIAKEQAKEEPNAPRIAEDIRLINRYMTVIKNAQRAQKELQKGQVKNRADLSKLAKQYTDLANQLKAAEDALADAKKTRDDAAASVSERFSDLPSMLLEEDEDPTKVLERFKKALTNQVGAVTKYSQTLEQLRALGLDDHLYQQLIDEGVGAQEFASQLLAGGSAAVSELNGIDSQLTAASTTFGQQTSKNLYQAGVDAAQGVVDGLKSQMKAIEDQIGILARTIVKAIRRALRIKSPSRVMMEIGKLTGEGVAVGLKQAEPMVQSAVDSMKDTIGQLSDALTADIDATPQITPVVDLSQVQSGAKEMRDILSNVIPINTDAALRQADEIARAQAIAQEQAAAQENVGTTVNFEQNNYSPKALTEIEIYRKTRNQLAQAQSALA